MKRTRKSRRGAMQALQQGGPTLRQMVLVRAAGHCAYCGVALTLKTMTLDHMHPVARGGPPDLDNIVAACAACNTQKSAQPVEQFCAPRAGLPGGPHG